jgi:hypothetical protein
MIKLSLIKTCKKNAPIWLYRFIGIFMISHFVYLSIRCFYKGEPENILWVSHTGTLIGGIGALMQSRLLVSVALVSLAGHHSFWMIDTFTWLFTGAFPFGTTTYLKDANILDWLQSANHFFSMPLLLILGFFQGGIQRHAWIGSSLLFAILAVLSFFISPVSSNVNSVHQLWPGLDTSYLSGLDQLPSALYLGALVLINTLANYLPSYLILALLIGTCSDGTYSDS